MKFLKISLIAIALPVCLAVSFMISRPALADCAIASPTNAAECLDGFYSGNDILYYDPTATTACSSNVSTISTTTGGLVGNDNAEKIFKFLVAKGLSAEQAAGVLGNFQQESGFDPAIIQGGAIASGNYTPVNGIGFGIAQWTFTARQGPLIAMAKSTNRSVTDLSLQPDFLWQELNSTLTSLKGVTSPEQAAYVFHRDFEGSADSQDTVIKVRGGNARQLYQKYKGMTAAATVSVTAKCQPAASAKTVDMMSDSFKIFNQCQFPPYGGAWGTKSLPNGETMCQAGCAPTALAMIAKNLAGQDVTPEDTANYYTSHNLWYSGGGSNLSSPLFAAKDFGLTVEVMGATAKTDVNAYKEVFAKGGLIMASSTGTSPFTSNRHTIVLRGITADNKFLIADPGQGTATNTPPGNQPSVDKILTDIRTDTAGINYIFYKQQGAV